MDRLLGSINMQKIRQKNAEKDEMPYVLVKHMCS